jgi:putative ABC transport system permease protein
MFKSYIKIAIRNLLRQKGYSFINIVGLAIGMAACMLILLFIQWELSFENMHQKSDRIYRVMIIDAALGTHAQRAGITFPAVAPDIKKNFPEVEDALRLSGGPQVLFTYGDNSGIFADRVRSCDPNFFEFFDFQLLQGDPATALVEPYSVVLTKTLADQIFGDEDPIGKTLRTGRGYDVTVTGVIQDLPNNTHLEFDALSSISTLESRARENQPEGSTDPIWLESYNIVNMPTYMLLREGVSPEGLDEKFTQMIRDKDAGENFSITVQPLLDVHLKSTDIIFDTIANKSDINNIYIFSIIAILILLIASVNYMNLSTARSAERAKEVGLRKVVGSMRSQLMMQFLGESLITTLISLVIAIHIAILVLPFLNNLSGASMSLNIPGNMVLDAFILGMLAIVGALAGLYPAFVLANFRPVTVLKGTFHSGRKGTFLRKALVVFQFTLSIALICMTVVVQKQMHYIKNKDIGYNRHQVVIFDMANRQMTENLSLFRDDIAKHSAFVSAATSTNIPGRTFGRTGIAPEGASEDDIWIVSQMTISPETIPTLGMEIVEGRNFSRERSTDTSGVVLINQAAVRHIGWDKPIGKKFFFGEEDSVGAEVVGVVKDYHFIEMRQNIEPVVMFPLGNNPGYVLTARIQPGRIPEAIAYAEEKWQEAYPEYPFSYSFMDEEFDEMYRRDMNTSKVVNIFSGLAIFIACLGLFGLASHSTTQRIKEIGVRKVLGASVPLIIRLLVLDFIKWVVLANLFALPLAWYASSQWLQGFAYRVELNLVPFIVASLAALTIAIITVLSQSWRAALLNPAKALRYE